MEDSGPISKKSERDERTGLAVEKIKRDILDNLFYLQGKFPEVATLNDWYLAVAHMVKDRLMNVWVKSAQDYYERAARTVCYFSAEFLLGPQLGMNLLRLGLRDAVEIAARELGIDLDGLIEYEGEPGLGSGGLGRLAACFMESLATLQVPAAWQAIP